MDTNNKPQPPLDIAGDVKAIEAIAAKWAGAAAGATGELRIAHNQLKTAIEFAKAHLAKAAAPATPKA